MKKYLKLVLLLIIALVIAIIATQSNRHKVNPQKLTSNSGVNRVCYRYEQKSDIYEPKEEGINYPDVYDVEYIELNINDDSTVSGIHKILPAEKDSNHATFVGVTDGVFVNVIATANAEGQSWQEQRLYKLENDNLFVGYQTVYVPQYKNDDGVYMYEDLNKLIFETDEFFLEKTQCDTLIEKGTL